MNIYFLYILSEKIGVYMNLQLIFRVNGAILFINGLFFLFLTEMFLGMAGFDITAQLKTLGQAMGVTLFSSFRNFITYTLFFSR